MTFAVHGGPTNAGCKRPLREPGKPWYCDCRWAELEFEDVENPHPGYLVRCPDCGSKRP